MPNNNDCKFTTRNQSSNVSANKYNESYIKTTTNKPQHYYCYIMTRITCLIVLMPPLTEQGSRDSHPGSPWRSGRWVTIQHITTNWNYLPLPLLSLSPKKKSLYLPILPISDPTLPLKFMYFDPFAFPLFPLFRVKN